MILFSLAIMMPQNPKAMLNASQGRFSQKYELADEVLLANL